MAKIMLLGATKVVSQLKGQSLSGNSYLTVRVGYATPYAIYVHENLSANHPNGGQAKYLEQPSRLLRQEMRDVIAKKLRQKKALHDALVAAAKLLYDASRLLVPVDTGRLKNSAFIEVT